MASLPDEKIGDITIRIIPQGGMYRGCLIQKGKTGPVREDQDLRSLQTRLRNEAGTLHPNYVGVDGAVQRFLSFFSNGGFTDPAFARERDYKLQAQGRLLTAMPLEAAREATSDNASAARAAFSTNMLSQYESARMFELLRGSNATAYVRSAARLADGDLAAGLSGMVAAIAPHGRHSWPMMTYLPALWLPDRHMFLKPNATLDFAQRIGHRFQYDYSADAEPSIYESLLDLMHTTRAALAPLGPRDGIDVQSFIWVVGSYTDDDRRTIETERRS